MKSYDNDILDLQLQIRGLTLRVEAMEPMQVSFRDALAAIDNVKAELKTLRADYDATDQLLGTHKHMPNGSTVFDFEDGYPEDDTEESQ